MIDRQFVQQYRGDETEEYLAVRASVGDRPFLDRDTLRQIAAWKSPRIKPHVNKNDEEFIREVTQVAFSAKDQGRNNLVK